MKNVKKKDVALALLLLTVCSCDKEVTTGTEEHTPQPFTANAVVTGFSATGDNEPAVNMLWNETDAFDLYLPEYPGNKYEFKIDWNSAGDDKTKANFTCTRFTRPEEGTAFYSFYPAGKFQYAGGKYHFILPEFTQSVNGSTDHLKEGFAMQATGNFSDNVSLSFAHKTALLKMEITNKRPEETTIQSLELTSGTSSCFGYTYSTDGTSSEYPAQAKKVSLGFNEGIKLDASGGNEPVLEAYTLTMPGAGITDETVFAFIARLADGTTVRSQDIPGSEIAKDENSKTWKAGCCYTFQLELEDHALRLTSFRINDFETGKNDNITL